MSDRGGTHHEIDHARILSQRHTQSDPSSSVIAPIYTSTTYARDDAHKLPTFGPEDKTLCYSRPDNPTLQLPERMLAELEGGEDAALFASGMAAVTCVLNAVVGEGEIVLCPRRAYFAVRARIKEWCSARGAEVVYYDPDQPCEQFAHRDVFTLHKAGDAPETDFLCATLQERLEMLNGDKKIALVWIESPANPTWDVMDIEKASRLSKRSGVRCVCVDSTVLTPICSKPLSFGADIVMHSATKYLNGHSDVLAGALVTNKRDDVWRNVLHERKLGGAVLGSFDAYLLTRGMRTLELRVRHQSESALWLARELEKACLAKLVRLPSSSDTAVVLYPGLESHPQHETAKRMCPDGCFGGMLSVVFLQPRHRQELPESGESLAKECAQFAANCRNWTCATSLGGFESLIEHRYSVEYSGPEYTAMGLLTPHVPMGLLRLSVGLENKEDLLQGFLESLPRF